MEIENHESAPISSENLIKTGEQFIRPDRPSRCTWEPGLSKGDAPHSFQEHTERPEILPNILYAVGNTPLVRLNKIPKSFGIKCEMLAKCEFLNPAGSVKDRIAVRMIEDAEKRGLLKPGYTIIEPSSGNTGLGLAMAAAVKGYSCTIVMPQKMSNEKVKTLKALGANVVRTPTSASFDSPNGLIAVAQKLCKEIPNSIILDQYRNSCNPIAHYEHTAQEILNQCKGQLDAVVSGAGTGGTVSGIARKIKELLPTCRVIAADPLGSILSVPEELNESNVTFYEVEGIGYDFVPTVLDRSVVDKWYKTNDKDSLLMARRLIKEEGLLCGGSSGSAMCAALEVAKSLNENQRLVVILPDGMRNYMSKFIDDSWMNVRDFECSNKPTDFWWSNISVSTLMLRSPPTVPASAVCSMAVTLMKDLGLDYIFPIANGNITGIVTHSKILFNIAEGKNTLKDGIGEFVEAVRTVDDSVPLGKIASIVQKEKFVLIKSECSGESGAEKFVETSDLINFFSNSGFS